MLVYQIVEFRNWDEHYTWGIYSSEENAKLFLKEKKWDECEDFEIIPYLVDERLNNKERELGNNGKIHRIKRTI